MNPRILTLTLGAFCAAALMAPATSIAGLSGSDVARLGGDLTPVGAEKAGNKDGTIPAWTGPVAPPAGWSPGKPLVDPFAADKPKFTIDAANADKYKANLTAGEYALLKRYPNYTMQVYPTRRSVGYPQSVTDGVKAQASQTTLDGDGVKNLTNPAYYFPFPVPKNGLEVIWNHLLRYNGGGFEFKAYTFLVRSSGDYSKFGLLQRNISAENFDKPKPTELRRYLSYYTEPASLNGTMYLVHDPVDPTVESRSAWIYNAGQRRVRRAPDLAYDMITDGSEGMYTVDQLEGFNGAPDRYDWKLVGKKEIYVPYNSYKMESKSLSYADIIAKNTINPANVRYELHRTWVVEGTLKSGAKHLYGKRTFYVDEDSWMVLAEDAYDTRGGLWRVGLHGLIPYYGAKVPLYAFNIYHDLTSGDYCLYGVFNETDGVRETGVKARVIDFEPDALRRLGTK